MCVESELRTQRLLLRQWKDADREPFAAMNVDPAVMRFFPELRSRAWSDRAIDIWRAEIEERGWSNWAVQLLSSGTFIGFVGLGIPRAVMPFTPCVEVGYRLAKDFWGLGFATEAAQAAVALGFTRLHLKEIVSFTALINLPSRAVMERLGMVNADQDFEHPAVPEGSVLRRHCLYRLSHARWTQLQPAIASEGAPKSG